MGAYFDGSQSGPFAVGEGGMRAAQGRPPGNFMDLQTSSFADVLASRAPGLMPGREPLAPHRSADPAGTALRDLPHATTIVAATCDHGVVLAGDRRATAGSMIAKRDVEKVFRSDEYSAVGYAGTGSVGIEFVRLFQVELEHYEKMEGRSLSLEGKANRLAWMIRGNLAAAMQGLVVVPLFVGYDEDAGIRGGSSAMTWPAARTRSSGSTPSARARYSPGAALKKLYADDMPVGDAVLACVQALYDAADDDSATGGPDLTRRIFPVIATVTADGFRKLTAAESEQYAEQVVQGRMSEPDGPQAPLHAAG